MNDTAFAKVVVHPEFGYFPTCGDALCYAQFLGDDESASEGDGVDDDGSGSVVRFSNEGEIPAHEWMQVHGDEPDFFENTMTVSANVVGDTPDSEECMTVGDEVVVLSGGRLALVEDMVGDVRRSVSWRFGERDRFNRQRKEHRRKAGRRVKDKEPSFCHLGNNPIFRVVGRRSGTPNSKRNHGDKKRSQERRLMAFLKDRVFGYLILELEELHAGLDDVSGVDQGLEEWFYDRV